MSGSSLTAWRGALFALGLILLTTGAGLLLIDVAPSNYFGIGLWLVLALLVNDGVVALTAFAISVLLRRIVQRRGDSHVAFVIAAIVQGAIVVAAIVTVVVVPEIFHQSIGTANPTVLPLEYGRNLLAFHAILVTGVVLLVSLVLLRRAGVRRSASRR